MAFYDREPISTPDTTSIRQEMSVLSDELTVAIGELRESSKDYAIKDNDMRKAEAKAFLKAEGKNKEEREAKADAGWATERLAASLAEAEKDTNIEHVRSLRAQLSAKQSLLYANRAEHDGIRYGQTHTT